ncbi:MAG: family 65 glycosyl hydrolase [Bacteroidetes bacterium]|nr:MAG: family 65 glycosyl hydrolase [Bacteroidota bacterium]
MKNYIKHHPWHIIEEGFDPNVNRVSESIFSIGNGKFGQRANFEEKYSGDSLEGNYIAGVYYPDKTRVGWWKNGYPEYFAKVLNAPNWTGIEIEINGTSLDLSRCDVQEFSRKLDMQKGLLLRSFKAKMTNGPTVTAKITRFCSLAKSNLGVISYSFSVDQDADITITSSIDGKIKNEDSNYDEKFWKGVKTSSNKGECLLIVKTKKTDFYAGIATFTSLSCNGDNHKFDFSKSTKKYSSITTQFKAKKNEAIVITKKAIIISSLDYDKKGLKDVLTSELTTVRNETVLSLQTKSEEAWAAKWKESDIIIEGDISAQQAIRFNIFQLNCTYTGEDERLNIGPKGFTGEKYGGSTYWDTEAYCLPFYQATSEPEVARNLLIYRYKHLPKAIENAKKLGFTNGAALYPMVTMNGEECHNEWEITFEEIHRNGAIAYAIYDYIKYTNDKEYLAEYGLEVLIGIARFWAQRVNWSEDKQQYVMLGVTGPNEFENNINNNWYTNKIAAWSMDYCREVITWVSKNNKADYNRIVSKTNFHLSEAESWANISKNMYYPYSEKHNVFLQQDGFLDKELTPVKDLPESQRPIVEHWSWDRILRSCYIKQADTLQGLYFFEDEYSDEVLKRHYDFYEPLTVHESSLSPCVHSILAAKLGDEKRAYEFYLRTARLDLDDYNNDTRDGLHITSMAGTWLSIVKGFAGMRVNNDKLSFKPFLPEHWNSFSFKIRFRGEVKQVTINKQGLEIN